MLAYSGCLLTRTAVQAIPDTEETQVECDSEVHDTDSFHDVTSPGNIVIPVGLAGTYHIYASIEWESNAVGIRYIGIKINAVEITRTTSPTVAGHAYTQLVGISYALSAGDIVTLHVYQTSGGSLDVERNAYTPRFGVDLMGK